MGDAVLCAERGKKLSGGRLGFVLREEELSGGRDSFVC